MTVGEEQQTSDPIQFADFLERIPPGVTVDIIDLFTGASAASAHSLSNALIQLHCDSDACQGVRFFGVTGSNLAKDITSTQDIFLTYVCRNCRSRVKSYALRIKKETSTTFNGTAMKFGEIPSFGPPVPARVISLIGPDRDLFLRGRRCENQGLGIGAFSYYRRVVENQKGRLISEIASVARRLSATPEVLHLFEQAAGQTQFSRAINDIKSAIPQVLLIDGHNPLVLLHSALSEGLHAGTDEECLETATSIRIVLTELAERISLALKDETELKQAIGTLMRRKAKDE
jgi:hypothetical protein